MPKNHPETKMLIIKRLRTRSTANASQRQVQRGPKNIYFIFFEETRRFWQAQVRQTPQDNCSREPLVEISDLSTWQKKMKLYSFIWWILFPYHHARCIAGLKRRSQNRHPDDYVAVSEHQWKRPWQCLQCSLERWRLNLSGVRLPACLSTSTQSWK